MVEDTRGDDTPSGTSGGHVRILRVLDAAANRAGEALRVVEDYTRLVLDDRHLTRLCKELRHDLAALLARIEPARRAAARDTQSDVGTGVAAGDEYQRADARNVARANFQRLAQSLRSLEEYAKVLAPEMAGRLEALRYRAYTIERAAELTAGSIERLAAARLYVILDGGRSTDELAALARSLIAAGADVLQLRDKRLGDRELLDRAAALRRLTARSDTLLVINDRPDLAALARADGVHLGQEDLRATDARAIVGADALVGVSTHSIGQARQAVLDGADYLGVGPVFPSQTKRFERCPGIELVRAVAAEIALPAFAIGGIDAANLPEVLAAGLTRAAVAGAIAAADDPAGATRALRSLLQPSSTV